MDFTTSYVNAELTAVGPTNLGNVGDRLPGSSEFTMRLGLGYNFILLKNDAFVRSDLSYVSDYLHQLGCAGANSISSGATFDWM